MKKALLLLLAGFYTSLVAGQSVLVVGDSISAAYNIPVEAGWVNLFRHKLEAEVPGPHQVINASISGDTTAGGLSRLPDLLARHQPEIVIIELGGNDGLRGLSLHHMKSNLDNMVMLSRQSEAQVFIVGVALPPSYGKVFNQKFQDVFSAVAEKQKIPLIAFGLEILRKPEFIQEDGIHPTALAQPLIAEHIWSFLVDYLN